MKILKSLTQQIGKRCNKMKTQIEIIEKERELRTAYKKKEYVNKDKLEGYIDALYWVLNTAKDNK